jgi:hypothetical protein
VETLARVGYRIGDLVRIAAPLLDHLVISFLHQPIFDTPKLAQPHTKVQDTQRSICTFLMRGVGLAVIVSRTGLKQDDIENTQWLELFCNRFPL